MDQSEKIGRKTVEYLLDEANGIVNSIEYRLAK